MHRVGRRLWTLARKAGRRLQGPSPYPDRLGDADLNSIIQKIRESGLFDAGWYRQEYPDVVTSGEEPLAHFCFGVLQKGATPVLASTRW